MTAPARSFTEIAKVGQESAAAAVRIWADFAKASVEAITSGPSELLDSRRAAEFLFGFANQVLDGQRAVLSAMTSASSNRRTAVAEIAAATAASGNAVAEKTAETTKAVAEKTAETAVEATTKTAEIVADSTAKSAEIVANSTAKSAETVADSTAKSAETVAETTTKTVKVAAKPAKAAAKTANNGAKVAKVAKVAEGPYGAGSHAPLADRSEIPAGFEIKGNDGSKLYHVPGSSFYKRTTAEVWFATPEAAEAAGFLRPASQR